MARLSKRPGTALGMSRGHKDPKPFGHLCFSSQGTYRRRLGTTMCYIGRRSVD